MSHYEESMKMQTTRPETESELKNYSRLGNQIRNLGSSSNVFLITVVAIEFVALQNLAQSRFNIFSQAPWTTVVSTLLSIFVLKELHQVLVSSLKQWSYDHHTLRLREEKAKDLGLVKVEFPYTPLLLLLIMASLSVLGSIQLVETYAYKHTHKNYDSSIVDTLINNVENNRKNVVQSIELRSTAALKTSLSPLSREIARLEAAKEKLYRVKASNVASSNKANEISFINKKINTIKNKIEDLKNNAALERQKAIEVATTQYTAKNDSLLLMKQKGFLNNDNDNQKDALKANFAQQDGQWTGVCVSLIFLFAFCYCQNKQVKYSVVCGIYEQHNYSFIDSIGGVMGIFSKITSALWKEKVSKKLIDFYNKYTIKDLSELDNTFEVKSTTKNTKPATPTTSNVSSVGTTSYTGTDVIITLEEMKARFKDSRKNIGNYVGFWGRGERKTKKTLETAKKHLSVLKSYIEKCNDPSLFSEMSDFYDEADAVFNIVERELKEKRAIA